MKPILKQFEEGICFACGEKLKEEYYIHYECAIAYSDEKSKRIKEYNLINEMRQDKRVNKLLNKK